MNKKQMKEINNIPIRIQWPLAEEII